MEFFTKVIPAVKAIGWLLIIAFTLGMSYQQFFANGKPEATAAQSAATLQLKMEMQDAMTNADNVILNRVADDRKQTDVNTTEIAVLKNDLGNIKDALGRIEKKLDKVR